jgi:hypothetical protein
VLYRIPEMHNVLFDRILFDRIQSPLSRVKLLKGICVKSDGKKVIKRMFLAREATTIIASPANGSSKSKGVSAEKEMERVR